MECMIGEVGEGGYRELGLVMAEIHGSEPIHFKHGRFFNS